MESESNDLRIVSRHCNYDQLSEPSVKERENCKSKQRKKLTQTERNEMKILLGRLTTGRIVQDIQIIAEHFGCSSITVHRMHSNFKAEKQIENERILQSAIWGEARPSQPQALGFAGQPSYFAHATPLTSSVLANARSNRKLHEVRGRSRQFARRPARYRPPGQQSAHPKHKFFLASPQCIP